MESKRVEPARIGGTALKNGLVLQSERFWAAAVRGQDGSTHVASGRKRVLIGAATDRVPLVRGLARFGESLVTLAAVRSRLGAAVLPLESTRIAVALAGSLLATSALRAVAPDSVFVQEAGTALAAFVSAVAVLKDSPIAGYHAAEHKLIGGREANPEDPLGGQAPKEHDRCGSNLVGPYLVATVLSNWTVRKVLGGRTSVGSVVAGAVSLGTALEALRWANRHSGSTASRLLLAPGRFIQHHITTTEPTAAQMEVGQQALGELLRLEDLAR